MRVLVLTQFYPPDIGAAANRMEAHCSALVRAGHNVTVVAPMASYPSAQLQPCDKSKILKFEKVSGVKLVRFRPLLLRPRSLFLRMAAEAFIAVITLILGFVHAVPAETVVASSPSPFLGVTAVLLHIMLRRKHLIWEVRDLTWQYAFGLGKLRGDALRQLTEQVVRWIAQSADSTIVTNAKQQEYLVSIGVSSAKVLIVHNGVEPQKETPVAQVPQVASTLNVTYIGLVGHPQGMETLVDVAQLAASENMPVRFHIVGDGAEFSTLHQSIRDRALTNITCYGPRPKAELHHFYRQADVLFAQLRDRPVFDSALPSKILEYMASGRPTVFAGRGPGADVLREAGAGIVVQPESPNEIWSAIKGLYEAGPDARMEIGLRGQLFVGARFSRKETAAAFVRAVEGKLHEQGPEGHSTTD